MHVVGLSCDIRPKPHAVISEHRHTGSSEEGLTSHRPLSNASVAKQVTSLAHPTYVAKHIPAFSLSHLPPKVFLNTNPFYPTFSTLPTPTPMDVFKQRCQPQENPLSIPMSLMHHHYSEGPMQSSIHFNYLTHMDQLKEKQEKFYAARHQRIQQQKGKLSTCSELPKCCERYAWACDTSVLIFVVLYLHIP